MHRADGQVVVPLAPVVVDLDRTPLRLGDPGAAIRAGVTLVPEDRKAQGVVLDLPIADNIAVSNLDRLSEGAG
jgi:ribose transport system ATP-binding protein